MDTQNPAEQRHNGAGRLTAAAGESSVPQMGQAAGWILTAAVLVFVVALCVNPARANDLLWQLRTGHWILIEHHPPVRDEYSWTRFGTPWVAHEWLTFVVLWLSYRADGFAGVFLLTAALSIVTWCAYYRLVLRELGATTHGAAPVTAFFLTCFAAVLVGPFFNPRPQLITYLFTVIVLAVALNARRCARDGSPEQGSHAKRSLWWIVPLCGLWANFHAGVLIGLGLLALLTIGDALGISVSSRQAGGTVDAACSKDIALCRAMACVVAAGLAATLCTPYGIQEFENFRATITNTTAMNMVGEWASPSFHDSYGWMLEGFAAFLLFSLFATKLKFDPGEAIVLAVFTHEALAATRNVPLLGLVGGLIIARHFQSGLVRLLYREGTRPADALFGPTPSTMMVACVFVAVAFTSIGRISAALTTSGPARGSLLTRIALTSIDYGSFPVHACAFMEREHLPNNVYNSYDDGGFIAWRLPDRPVFVDSRADVYFGSILTDVISLYGQTYRWRSLMAKHHIDVIVTRVSDAQSRQYLAAPDWALVYVDRPELDSHPTAYSRRENDFVFVRRTPAYAGLIERCRRDCPAVEALRHSPFGQYESLL